VWGGVAEWDRREPGGEGKIDAGDEEGDEERD